MRPPTADGAARTLKPALMALAAAWLFLVQLLSAGHAWSKDVLAPDHDRGACVLCLASDRPATKPDAGPALAPRETSLCERVFEPVAALPSRGGRRPTSRGPPTA